MFGMDADAELSKMVGKSGFAHRDAALSAQKYRRGGDVADLLAIVDDPHACRMTEIVFLLAGSTRLWLNRVPMPSEAIIGMANHIGARRAAGEDIKITNLAVSTAECASAVAACRAVLGPIDIPGDFPAPDIRTPVRPGRYAVWRYEGTEPVPAVPAPSAEAVRIAQDVAGETWPSMLAGYVVAKPFDALPLDDLLGLLAHAPAAPDTPRWHHLATTTPTYWYRLLQPWVCLGILRHAADESWPTSTRRQVLVDLAFGVEDWTSDAALFALVTAAYRDPAVRPEVHDLVRARLDTAVAAPRPAEIRASLAHLILVTPGCTPQDRALAESVLADDSDEPATHRRNRRWWKRG